jgi:hypothetical protein
MTNESGESEATSDELIVLNANRALIYALSTFEAEARARIVARTRSREPLDPMMMRFRIEVARVAREAETYAEAAYYLAGIHHGDAVWGDGQRSLRSLERIARAARIAFETIAPPVAPVEDALERLPAAMEQLADTAKDVLSALDEVRAAGLSPEELREALDGVEDVAMYGTVLARMVEPQAATSYSHPALLMAQSIVDTHRAAEPLITEEFQANVLPKCRPKDRSSKAHRRDILVSLAVMLEQDAPSTAVARVVSPMAVFLEAAFRFGVDPRHSLGGKAQGVFFGAAEAFEERLKDSTRNYAPTAEALVNLALRCLGHDPATMEVRGRKKIQRERDALQPDRPRQNNGRGKSNLSPMR